MTDRSLLPREVREAIRAEVLKAKEELDGNESAVATRFNQSQQVINKLVREGRVGPAVARDILGVLGLTEEQLLKKHATTRRVAEPTSVNYERLHPNFVEAIEARKRAGTPFSEEAIFILARRANLSGPDRLPAEYAATLDDIESDINRRLRQFADGSNAPLPPRTPVRVADQDDLEDLGPPKKKLKR